MPTFLAAPTFARVGVIAGFILDAGAGLTPTITPGVLIAQGMMYRPALAPGVGAVAASAQSWLWWGSTSGFYWSATASGSWDTPRVAGDAFLGWVRTNATHVIAFSARRLGMGPEAIPVGGGVVTIPIGAGGDTNVPPTPYFGVGVSQGDAAIELTGFSFTGGFANCGSITSGTATLYYVDELDAPGPLAVLTGALNATDNYLVAAGLLWSGWDATTPATPPELILIEKWDATGAMGAGGEVIQITQPGGVVNGGNLVRGQKGSHASAHAVGSRIWRVKRQTVPVVFPAGYFTDAYWADAAAGGPQPAEVVVTVPFRAKAVVSADFFVTNAVGDSPVRTADYTNTVDGRMRVLTGGQIQLTVEGVIGIESNAVPAAYLPAASPLRDIFAVLEGAADANVVCVVKVSGVAIATLTITAGQFTSPAMSPEIVIPAGVPVTLDVTAVGSVYPGRRLMVLVRL